jgi:nucleoside-diphosphate-sugar epimerase
MTALVTDLTHPIGRHILDAAAARGQPCKVLASAEDLDETRGAELVTGTIDDDAALLAAVRDVDVVYHTALIAQGTPDKLRRVNVDGTRRLLEACAGDIRRFVLISTPAVYASHPTPDSWPVLADEPREAHGPATLLAYGQSMIEAEDLVMEASRLYGMEYTVLRIATLWGGNPYTEGLARILMRDPSRAVGINHALGRPLQWLHGRDAARAAVLAGAAEAARNQTYIVAAEQANTTFDILATLWDITRPGEDNPFAEDAAAHHVPRPKLDTAKIARALDFRPIVSLRECLEEAVQAAETPATRLAGARKGAAA